MAPRASCLARVWQCAKAAEESGEFFLRQESLRENVCLGMHGQRLDLALGQQVL